ncbi:MAG: hypothetical protein ABFR33_01835 [Verrucomicrobiota bacterium]
MKWNVSRINAWAGIIILLFGWLCVASTAETVRTGVVITYRIPEGVYINAGTDAGLQLGMTGSMVLENGRTLGFEVLQAARNTALLRLEGAGGDLLGTLQSRPVELVFDAVPPSEEEAVPAVAAPGEGEVFVPLLAPLRSAPEVVPTKNISHGSIGVQQTYQEGTDSQLDYAVTRLYTSGNIDRLFGSAWSFVWSGSARYRTGDGYLDHSEYETVQPLIYSAAFQHPLSGEGFVRAGRFLPFELPGIGYLDGGQVELDTSGHWSFGVAGGLKPRRVDLAFSGDEPTAAGYATFEVGERISSYYSGTAGLLGSLYKGEVDRVAVLLDQRAGFGPRFNLLSTAEIDFGAASTTNSQTQLSRFDLTASSRLHGLLTLRAGAGHWQRLDSQAQRDQFLFVDDQLFDDGYWRYWIGARHDLPLRLRLNEEVAYIVSDATDDAMRWRIGLTHSRLLGWRFSSLSATFYNLESQGFSGYGGLLNAYLPFRGGRIAIRPSASMRWLDPDNGGEGLAVTYYGVHLDARVYKHWLLSGGVSSTSGDGADALLFDLGLRYSW